MRASKPKIGIIANGYERGAGLFAGGQRHFIEVVKRWRDVDLVLFAPEYARDDMLAALPSARFVAMPSLGSRPPKALDFLLRALLGPLRLRALRSVDALLAVSHYLPDVLPAVLARRPLAVVVHHVYSLEDVGTVPHGALANAGERISLRLAMRCADVIVAGSAYLRTRLQQLRPRARILVTTNGIDHLALPAEVSLDGARSGAIMVARMHPAKGVIDAVRAWREVCDQLPGARLTIVGAEDVPAYGAQVRTLVDQFGLGGSVRLAGAMRENEKLRALLNAKMFLFPSYEEGWAIALAEAMRCGLPAVTYDLPVFSEVFPRGRIEVGLGDVKSLAAAVVALLSDETLRLKYAAEALELGRTFTWEAAASIEEKAVRGLIKKSPRRG